MDRNSGYRKKRQGKEELDRHLRSKYLLAQGSTAHANWQFGGSKDPSGKRHLLEPLVRGDAVAKRYAPLGTTRGDETIHSYYFEG